MKIGVSSYSFNRLMTEGKVGLMELPAIAAKMGYEAIELLNNYLPDSREVTEATFAKAAEFKAACEAAGIAVAAYLCSSNFLGEGGPEAEAEYLIRKEEARQRRNAAPARYRRAEREGRRVLVIRTEDGTFVCETIVTPERLRSRIPFVEAEDFTRK